ncbi:MAG: hypothetical protein EBZ77_12005 [Chitinophagia bacterium]|nr:hypothetical protein [Chitinophagia bacterium]
MRADSNGSFTFTGLPAGWYRVKAVTRNNDVLISQNVLVKEQSDDSYVDEFSLLLKNLTFKRQQYADTPLRVPVDSILVRKARRELCVYHHHKLCKIYHISLGFEPEGAKHVQGDGRTPEGLYFINGKNPNSTYHKNLGISYPSPADIAYARKLGQPTGGDVKIHGLPAGEEAHRDDYVFDDWTWGCIALMNEEIDELCQFVPVGTPILIQP